MSSSVVERVSRINAKSISNNPQRGLMGYTMGPLFLRPKSSQATSHLPSGAPAPSVISNSSMERGRAFAQVVPTFFSKQGQKSKGLLFFSNKIPTFSLPFLSIAAPEPWPRRSQAIPRFFLSDWTKSSQIELFFSNIALEKSDLALFARVNVRGLPETVPPAESSNNSPAFPLNFGGEEPGDVTFPSQSVSEASNSSEQCPGQSEVSPCGVLKQSPPLFSQF